MYAVEAIDLSHKQGAKHLLREINWNIAENEHWVLFGLNGCGKTTLLSILAGYRHYSAGTIKLFGEILTKENAIALRRQVSFVSTSFFDNLYNHENVLNIVLSGLTGNLNVRHTITDADVRKAKQLLTALGLREKYCYPYDLLSKGQRQKVLIARALINPPKLLILDEPCTGLDIFAREFFLNTISQIAAETNTAIIYVTHHVDEIIPTFTKAALMKNGSLHSQGNLTDIFTAENMSDFFEAPTSVSWNGSQVNFHVDQNLCMKKDIWNQNNPI